MGQVELTENLFCPVTPRQNSTKFFKKNQPLKKWNSTHENAPPPADSSASKTTPPSKSTSLMSTKLVELPAITSLMLFAVICDEWANLMMLLTDWLRMTGL